MKRLVLALYRPNGDDIELCFPDYPAITCVAKTLAVALKLSVETLVEDLVERVTDGEKVVLPSDIDSAMLDNLDKIKAGWRAIGVEVDFPGNATRINITVPATLLSLIDRASAREGLSRSAYLAHAAADRLRASRDMDA
jgi:hypothetical protein